MAKHLCVREYKRARDAAYGREIVGLNVHVPWSAWENYEDGSGYDTATVVEYQSKLRPPRFKVAFPSYLEYDDLSLSWEEILAEKPCLNSNGEKAQLVTLHDRTTLSHHHHAHVPRPSPTGTCVRQHGTTTTARSACHASMSVRRSLLESIAPTLVRGTLL